MDNEPSENALLKKNQNLIGLDLNNGYSRVKYWNT